MKWVMLLPSIPTELNLGDRCLDGVLSNNNYESDVLKVQARWRPVGGFPGLSSVVTVHVCLCMSACCDSACLFTPVSPQIGIPPCPSH